MTKFTVTAFTSALLIVLSSMAFSQGSYLHKGQNGLGIEIGYSANNIYNGLGADFVYSYHGTYDLGISINNLSFIDKAGGVVAVSALAVIPAVTYHFMKQDSAGTPVSLSLTAEYERDSYNSQALDQLGQSLDANYFIGHADIYRNFYISSSDYIQPDLQIGYLTGSRIFSDNFGGTLSINNNSMTYGGGVSFVFRTSRYAKLRITPSLILIDSKSTYMVKVGYVFAK